MGDVTHILNAIAQGDPTAAGQLLPLVYDELRKLAESWLAKTPPGQTLQSTALVHEAYLRLVGGNACFFAPVAAREPSRLSSRWPGGGATPGFVSRRRICLMRRTFVS